MTRAYSPRSTMYNYSGRWRVTVDRQENYRILFLLYLSPHC